ncbi:MAG: hypothetical protein NTY01_09840 [Verrucomicrobia bacterium]|nr:hypothetical protein [Verrucomicrobiota bacterium]
MTRNGKIARMPRVIRDTVNLAFDAGLEGNAIVAWINAHPEAQKVLDLWFKGKPVTKQNLSEWKKGGYKEWRKQEEACDIVRRLSEKANALTVAADEVPISDQLSTVLMVELVSIARTLIDETADTQERWQRLQELFRVLARVRQGDFNAGKLTLKRLQWHVEMAKETARKESVKEAMPVVNLLMEEVVRSGLDLHGHHDQRAKDIMDKYFRPDDNGTASPPAQAGDPGSVQASQTQSSPVKPSPSQSE